MTGAAELAHPARGPVDDEGARVRLAARTTDPHILATLAQDLLPTVRAAVALNPAYAQAANLRLVRDTDIRVRTLLAGKVARLLPGLTGREHRAAQAHVNHMLQTLAGDVADHVRSAIAEALTTMPDAPRDLILKLARDPVGAVSDPIVRFSPLLTDADLLELLATPPHPGIAVSIASRNSLSAAVAHDIAVHASSPAVSALLSNPSASVQEATLDALVGRAGDHPEWHEPLVHRPFLSISALRILSRIVAGQLLDRMAARPDLPPGLAEDLRDRIAHSMAEQQPPPSDEMMLADLRRLHEAGELNEYKLLEAANAGDNRLAGAILAVASGVPVATVDRAVQLRSAKGLVSLASRAGYTMRAGIVLQATIGRLGPGETLPPATDGSFPLTASEMDWQIELLNEPARA